MSVPDTACVAHARGREGGFSLLDVIVAIVIITIGIFTLFAAIPQALQVHRLETEEESALSIVRSKIEELRAYPYSSVLSAYNGTTFTATSLTPPAVGNMGQITFLTESQAHSSFNANFDLNLNGTVNDTLSPTTAFVAYPLTVTLQWQSQYDNLTRTFTANVILYNDSH